jgi:hypothetical protein
MCPDPALGEKSQRFSGVGAFFHAEYLHFHYSMRVEIVHPHVRTQFMNSNLAASARR